MRDDEVMGDIAGSADFLRLQPQTNGKIGIIGFCSGGRHVYLAACQLDGIDAAVDCWGGGVVLDDPSQLNEQRPVEPITLTPQMKAPLMGIFGNEDRNPTPEHVNKTEEELKRHGKHYEFHRYDGAGHGFFGWERPGYRQEQAVDAWGKIWTFYETFLSTPVPATAGVA
jgi:carboxymethylenebutenolidase